MTDKKQKTITRYDLASQIFKKIGLSRSEAAKLVDRVFDEMTTALDKSGTVKLPDFGTFIAKERGRRIGRNPKTGEVIPIAPHIAVSFRSSPKLKTKVDEGLKQHQGIPKS